MGRESHHGTSLNSRMDHQSVNPTAAPAHSRGMKGAGKMTEQERLRQRIEEYANLAGTSRADAIWRLSTNHGWSKAAAEEIAKLAEGYGIKLLRNALAYAVVRFGGKDGTN